MPHFDHSHRVTYAETDRMGYVYYGNYLTYFEIGRTELIRASGKTYLALEEMGLMLPAVEATVKYHRPARYDDLLTVRTTVTEFKGIRLKFAYEILRDGEKLAEGMTLHAFVDREGKPTRPPAEVRELIEKSAAG